MHNSIKRTFSSILSLLLAVVLVNGAGAANLTQDQPPETSTSQIVVVSPYYSFENITTANGSEVTAHIINGPSQPLPEFEAERLASMTTIEPQGTLANFPSYSWVLAVRLFLER